VLTVGMSGAVSLPMALLPSHRPMVTFVVQLATQKARFRRLDDALRFASDHDGAVILVVEADGTPRSLKSYLHGVSHRGMRARRIERKVA
jgi:hypothetical protein